MKKIITIFLFCFLLLLAGYTINIILFGIESDINSWTHRISLLMGVVIGSIVGTIVFYYLDKKGLLFKNNNRK